MRIAIAIDSFKGSISTFESGAAVKEAAEAVFDNVEAIVCPLADGGEGTLQAICSSRGGEIKTVSVTDSLARQP